MLTLLKHVFFVRRVCTAFNPPPPFVCCKCPNHTSYPINDFMKTETFLKSTVKIKPYIEQLC